MDVKNYYDIIFTSFINIKQSISPYTANLELTSHSILSNQALLYLK